MENIDELYSKLGDNSDEIEKCEQEIEQLEMEVKALKQGGPASRMEMLQKQLKIFELEGEILGIQAENDRESMKAIKQDLINRKSEQYPEYEALGNCYKQKNDLDIWRNEIEILQKKYQILQQSGSKDTKAYLEITSQIDMLNQSIKNLTEEFEKSSQKFSTRFKKNIDVSKSFTDIFYEYDNEKAPVRYSFDSMELQEGISEEYYRKLEEFKDDDEKEKYKENVGKEMESIFCDGLDGTSKELAQVFSEIFTNEIDLQNENLVDRELLGEDAGVLSEVVKDDKGYVLIYENDEGNKVGIRCARNEQTGKIEIQERVPEDKSLESLESAERKGKAGNSITRDQMELQVVKRNIENSMEGKSISEIKEVTDPSIVEYLNGQNNLQQYSHLNIPAKIYMISTQDKEGNTRYEFVAHDSKNSYIKLKGMEQVEPTKSHISTEEYSVSGMKYMQSVECQFRDRNGNSYFVTHPFGSLPMELSVEEAEKTEQEIETVNTKDYGLNGLLNKTRINELLRAGYNAMSIGIEKVKAVYNKYRGKDQEKENNTDERGEE